MWNTEKRITQSGPIQHEGQDWEVGLDAGDGKPLKVSEQIRGLFTLKPWQRRETIIMVKGRTETRNGPYQQC